jgi:meso-butanediol dehydrogenase/(S,S)-butanediol dehydrogenase/diacetyl reductase
MTPRLDGKVALITGTGGGQGRSAALFFADAGAHVVGCDLKADGNRETVEMVRASGGKITTMEPVDLGNREEARRWVDAAAAIEGRIDIVYNNASATRPGAFETLSVEDWDFTMRNEIDLVFTVTQRAWPHLKRRGGVIINIASIAATHTTGGPCSAHNTAKGAIVSLSRRLAVEGAPENIRVVCITPGIVATPGTARGLAVEAIRQQFLSRNLIKRIGQPEDVAAAALFLASDYASYITGINLVVDGGYTAS